MAKRPTARARASRATTSSTTPALANLKSEYLLSHQSTSRLTKKNKRELKHDALLARVREGSGITKTGRSNGSGVSKVRRPNKKLRTDLNDMKNALDDVEMESDDISGGGAEKDGVYAEDEWEGVSDTSQNENGNGGDDANMSMGASLTAGKLRRRRRKLPAAEGKLVMKSLKHRPGSMKRKKVLEEREMERFKKNLAELAKAESRAGSGAGVEGGGNGEQHIQQRWRVLREFIGGTMVREKAFVGT